MPVHARSLQAIKQSGEIRVCIATFHVSIASVEPEGCRENCTFQGIAYEEAQAFVDYLGAGIRPKYLFVGWDEQFHNQEGRTVREGVYTPALLSSGQCDVYPSHLTKNAWRAKKLDFVSLFPNRMMVVVPKAKKAQFTGPADLAGKVAAVEKDTSFHTWLQEQNQGPFAPNPVRISLMPPEQILVALSKEDVDFTLFDADNAIWSTRHRLPNATVAFSVGELEQIGWAFRKQDQALQRAVQTFFDQQRAQKDSALNRIWQRYYGMNLPRFIQLISTLQ